MVTSAMSITGGGALTINGPGAGLLTLDGNHATRLLTIINVQPPGTLGAVIINNLTLARGNGAGTGGGGDGGGVQINNAPFGTYTTVNATFNNVTFRDGLGGGSTHPGGGIYCNNLATVNINSSKFTGNQDTLSLNICNLNITGSEFFENGRSGGGQIIACGRNVTIDGSAFYNNGIGTGWLMQFGGDGSPALTITNTTIANNISALGALRIAFGGVKTLRNVTIAGNISTFQNTGISGGLTVGPGVNMNVGNSIIANNLNFFGGADIRHDGVGNLTSQGYNLFENIDSSVNIIGTTNGNLIGVDPRLDGTPRFNGGTTRTLALRLGSPAIDTGDPTTFPATDQRGITRPQDGDGVGGARSDMGAYERRLIDVVPPASFDFDGDGRADLGVFRPSNGIWYLSRSSAGFGAAQWGISSDKLAPADYDGDGRADIAIWREESSNADRANFYILQSSNSTFRLEQFGRTGDVHTVVGDWDGDGRADPAVYRDGARSQFFYRPSSQPGVNFTTIDWGVTGDKPIHGDFDGDGKLDAAVFRASDATWYIRQSSNLQTRYDNWGTATDKFVAADYDADGKTDLAVFRDGTWYILQSLTSQPNYIKFGLAADTLVPADYDGDGRADVAVYRNGTWFINQTISGFAAINFGLAADRPVSNIGN